MNISRYLNSNIKEFSVSVDNISKAFIGNRQIFTNISFDINNGDIVAVTGRNGSGKTTLLKLLCGILKPTRGAICFTLENEIYKGDIRDYVSLVSPYLNLYEEFTPAEHIALSYRLCGKEPEAGFVDAMLNCFNLYKKKGDYISTFSSGMKQRVKYIIALSRKPHLLLLDEPYTNLDKDAVAIVEELIQCQSGINGAVIIASNDDREKQFCNKYINLDIG